MKFSDKLQKIRKENNITQEGLADRLNVSRQAVSKWESGSAYPDTEKLIQISKIFNITMDELINDDKKIDKDNINKKTSYKDIINKILEFISNSVNMFYSMKFIEKIKCLIEIFLLGLLFYIVGNISNTIIISVIRRIFYFLPSNLIYFIINIFSSLIYLVWLILGSMIIIKIFKNRYLDYYIFIKDNNTNKLELEEPIKELKDRKEYRVVIRDPKDSSISILDKVWKIILFIIRGISFIILIPIVLIFIFLIMIFIISLFYILDGLFFNSISIIVLGSILFIYLLVEFIFNIIFNREYVISRMFILFISSISIIGLGLGMLFISISRFNYDSNYIVDSISYDIDMDDNLVIDSIDNINTEIVIDDSRDNIKIDINSYNSNNNYIYTYNISSNNIYKIVNISSEYLPFSNYKMIINSIKDNKFIKYDYDYKVVIYVSSNNLEILKNNYNKYVME